MKPSPGQHSYRIPWLCCCSVSQSHLTLCDPKDYSPHGFPVLHYLPEFSQTHVHWAGDAIRPSCPLPRGRDALCFCHQSFQALGSFPVSWVFASSGQSIRTSASASSFQWISWGVQFSRSAVSDSATPWTAERQASLSITNSWSLLKPMSIESVMPSHHLILCHPLLLPPSVFPSIRVFSNESALCIRWPKYWSFRFNINPSNEHPGLISFRMDWLDLLAVQGTLKSLLWGVAEHKSTLVLAKPLKRMFVPQKLIT